MGTLVGELDKENKFWNPNYLHPRFDFDLVIILHESKSQHHCHPTFCFFCPPMLTSSISGFSRPFGGLDLCDCVAQTKNKKGKQKTKVVDRLVNGQHWPQKSPPPAIGTPSADGLPPMGQHQQQHGSRVESEWSLSESLSPSSRSPRKFLLISQSIRLLISSI